MVSNQIKMIFKAYYKISQIYLKMQKLLNIYSKEMILDLFAFTQIVT